MLHFSAVSAFFLDQFKSKFKLVNVFVHSSMFV